MALHTYVRPPAGSGIETPINGGAGNPAEGRAVIDLSWLDANAFDDADRGLHCMMLCEYQHRQGRQSRNAVLYRMAWVCAPSVGPHF